jgi:hypothetical protein
MNQYEDPMLFNSDAIDYLRKARFWASMLSIIALSLLGFGLVLAVLLLLNSAYAGFFSGLELVPLLVMVLIYFFPIWYLFKFSQQARIAVDQRDEEALSGAMRYLWLHYRYLGILLILMMLLYALMIPATILTPVTYS